MPHHTVLLISSLLALGGASASSNAIEERSHARDLQKRAEVDCGTWVMQCGGVRGGDGVSIEDICNNACFFQKYVKNIDDGPYVATFRKVVDNNHNRVHSGCEIGGKSVCKLMPFSQKMADGFNLVDPTCEEFPMADWTQDDFQDGQGQPRNALRCVEGRQNFAAGGQWLSFRNGNGEHTKRKCAGPMDQDNTDYRFTIEMNYDNTDPNLLGYCYATPPQGPSNIDSGEFWMNTLSLPNGANNFPLNAKDNGYITGAKWGDTYRGDVVWQCKLELLRTAGDNYNVVIYDSVENKELAEGSQALNKDGDRMVIDPAQWKDYPKLIVIRTGEMGKGGTPGSRIDFISSHTDDGSNPLTDFSFSTESQGWDDRFKKVDESDPKSAGLYCDVGNIDDSSENGPTQQITCYYPCNTL